MSSYIFESSKLLNFLLQVSYQLKGQFCNPKSDFFRGRCFLSGQATFCIFLNSGVFFLSQRKQWRNSKIRILHKLKMMYQIESSKPFWNRARILNLYCLNSGNLSTTYKNVNKIRITVFTQPYYLYFHTVDSRHFCTALQFNAIKRPFLHISYAIFLPKFT